MAPHGEHSPEDHPNTEDDLFLTNAVQNRIVIDTNHNDQENRQVRAVLFILKDAIAKPIDDIHDFLIEMLPLDVLFIEDCFVDYRIFSIVRSVLIAIGVRVRTDRGMLISSKVGLSLYTNDEDAREAVARVEAYQSTKRRLDSSSTVPRSVGSDGNNVATAGHTNFVSPTNVARNKATVASSFRDDEKFSGPVSGKIPLHRIRNRFMDTLSDQSIPKDDQVNLLHCCLAGMALDYYHKSIRGIHTTIDQALLALEKQFNSIQHQAQARTYLNGMTMDSIKKEKDCSLMEALEIAHNFIVNTVPNCGKEYQHDLRYCDFLERVIRSESWAQKVIQARLTPTANERMDYNTFYSKLCAALNSHERTTQHGKNSQEH